MLVIFRNVAKAIDCARGMQQTCEDYSAEPPEAEQIRLCVGLGFGRVLRIGDRDVFGSEVNAAAKLGEDIAKAREILVTDAVRDAAGPDYRFEPIAKVPPGVEPPSGCCPDYSLATACALALPGCALMSSCISLDPAPAA